MKKQEPGAGRRTTRWTLSQMRKMAREDFREHGRRDDRNGRSYREAHAGKRSVRLPTGMELYGEDAR